MDLRPCVKTNVRYWTKAKVPKAAGVSEWAAKKVMIKLVALVASWSASANVRAPRTRRRRNMDRKGSKGHMGGKPLVTVGLSFAGSSLSNLELAIRSVFNQTFDRWVLLLISDGASREACERIRQIDDPRVRLVVDGRRLGLAARLNQIAQSTCTPFLARMDDDDLMVSTRLARQVGELEASSLDLVSSRAIAVDAGGRILGILREPAEVPRSDRDFLGKGIFTHPTVMGRAQWFRDHPYDSSLRRGEDKDLWIRARDRMRVVKLPDPLLYYRVRHPNSAVQRRDAKADRAVVRRHGPEMVGWPSTLRYLLTSCMRQTMFGLAVSLPGMPERIVRSKVQEIDGATKAASKLMLDEIVGAAVPGWD